MELGTSDVFLDASFAIALVSARDEHHDDAVRAAEQYGGHPYVTTRPVLLEVGNALSGVGHRNVAASYLEAAEEEPSTEIVPLSADLFRRGFDLYRERPDKSWGLTDCISFLVMRERGIRAVLTADTDFEQAGFRALLRMSCAICRRYVYSSPIVRNGLGCRPKLDLGPIRLDGEASALVV